MRRMTITTLCLIAVPALLHAACDPAVAPTMFPEKLSVEAAARPDLAIPPVDRATTARCADLDGDGTTESLVTAYSNGISGVVRVVRVTGDEPVVVAEADTAAFFEPELDIIDLDSDRRMEIVVAAKYQADAKEYSVFRYAQNHLTEITPVAPPRAVDPGLGTVEFLDLDGDGRLEYVAEYRCTAAPCERDVFALAPDGNYAFRESPLYLAVFERSSRKPKAQRERFSVSLPDGAYDLVIASPAKQNLSAASAVIRLNGAVMARPDDFKNSGTMLRLSSVPITPENVLEVEMRGAPGSRIVITVVRHVR